MKLRKMWATPGLRSAYAYKESAEELLVTTTETVTPVYVLTEPELLALRRRDFGAGCSFATYEGGPDFDAYIKSEGEE